MQQNFGNIDFKTIINVKAFIEKPMFSFSHVSLFL